MAKNENVKETVNPVDTVETPVETLENPFAVVAVDSAVFETVEADTSAKLRYSTTTSTAKLFNALNSPSRKIKDIIGATINVTDIVITTAKIAKEYADREKENAEKNDKPCVHFFTDLGEHFASVSNGIIRATENLLSCGITPTSETPIAIKFVEAETKNGTAHSFEMV